MGIDVDLTYDGSAELAEGPVWNDGALWWVSILSGALNRLQVESGSNGRRELGGLVGMAVPCSDGRWLFARDRDLGLLDWKTGDAACIATVEVDRYRNRFNDGKCDPAGRLWVGTMSVDCEPSAGALYCLTSDLCVAKEALKRNCIQSDWLVFRRFAALLRRYTDTAH